MGTSAFDKIWDTAPAPQKKPSAFDAAWDAPVPTGHDYHAEYRSGMLQKRMDAANARDAASANDPDAEPVSLPKALLNSSLATAANLSQAIPGAEAAQAGIRSVVRQQPYADALNDIRGQTSKITGPLGTVEHGIGLTAALPLVSGMGVVGGGAAIGGASQALSADPGSLKMRALKTAGGAALGAATGGLLKGAGNVMQRTGVTDVIGAGLRRAPDALSSIADAVGPTVGNAVRSTGDALGSLGESIGTRGAANRLLAGRQDILDQLGGSEQSAAQSVIDHAQSYRSQASKLYDVARADKSVINHPKVQRALDDPGVQQMLQVARDRLGTGPNETVVQAGESAVPRLVAGGPAPVAPPVASDAPASTEEAIAAFNQRAQEAAARREGTPLQQKAREVLSRSAAESQLPPAAPSITGATLADAKPAVPEITRDLPSPEELALTKRLLGQVVQQKFNAPQGLNATEAARLQPLLDDLRSGLHEASPAWKDADAFYSNAKNYERTYKSAYGAAQTPSSGSLDPSKLKTQDAISASVDNASSPSIAMARASGQQAGTAARLAESIKNAPIKPTLGETLDGAGKVLDDSQNSIAGRRPAFGSTDAADAFTAKIALARSIAAREAGGHQSVSLLKPWQAMSSSNPLATEAGALERSRIASLMADPTRQDLIRQRIRNSTSGNTAVNGLVRSLLLPTNTKTSAP
jgi:hypothetical protein